MPFFISVLSRDSCTPYFAQEILIQIPVPLNDSNMENKKNQNRIKSFWTG